MRSDEFKTSTASAKYTATIASKTSYRARKGVLKASVNAQNPATARPMRAKVSQKGSVKSTGMMTQSMERNEPGAFGVPGTSMAMMAAKRTTS